jgi:hypothetical protein
MGVGNLAQGHLHAVSRVGQACVQALALPSDSAFPA